MNIALGWNFKTLEEVPIGVTDFRFKTQTLHYVRNIEWNDLTLQVIKKHIQHSLSMKSNVPKLKMARLIKLLPRISDLYKTDNNLKKSCERLKKKRQLQPRSNEGRVKRLNMQKWGFLSLLKYHIPCEYEVLKRPWIEKTLHAWEESIIL